MARSLRLMLSDEDELKKRGYVVGAILGEGSYAKVKWALSKNLDKKVALKIVSKKKAPLDFQQKFLPRELETMKILSHPNIVKLHEVLYFKDKIVMVMEMAGHGDLLEYVKLRGALNEDRARRMFVQLLSAIEYMHSFDVVHRDLKCENVLLDVENNVKLSDFGFSRIQRPDQLSRTYCGSAAYASPEVLQGIPYNGKTYDVWSLGVILYIMRHIQLGIAALNQQSNDTTRILIIVVVNDSEQVHICGSMPYDDTDVKKMIKYQTERKVGFSRHKKIGQDAKDLIHSILEANVDRRYSVRDIKYSTWMLSSSVPQLSQDSSRLQQQQPTSAARSRSRSRVPDSSSEASSSSRNRPSPDRQPYVATAVEADIGVSDLRGAETPLRTATLLSFVTFRDEDAPTVSDSMRPLPVRDDDHAASRRLSPQPIVELVPIQPRDKSRRHGRL